MTPILELLRGAAVIAIPVATVVGVGRIIAARTGDVRRGAGLVLVLLLAALGSVPVELELAHDLEFDSRREDLEGPELLNS